MFFSQALLWRKGPVANIWTAAYCFKKLKREQIAQTDIVSSVDQIIGEIEISYRILAHLLVGIVRIFSKKVEFLEEDCNKTLKNLTESFKAIYWTNPKKTKHVRKQTVHGPDTSSSGTHRAVDLLDALRAHPDQVVISIPARFELDLFDLEIADDCDAPDRHQQSTHAYTLDGSESDFFRHKNYPKGSGCRLFSSTFFTPIQDVIPVEMMIDLDLSITDLYESTSSKRENTTLNPDANASAKQHQESVDNLHADNPNREAETVEPSVGHQESPLIDVNHDTGQSAEQHQEPIQNFHVQDPNGEGESVEPSFVCHESPLKDINVSSKDKDVPILENIIIVEPLKLADAITDPELGLSSPKPMVRTPAKREISRNLRKHTISRCHDMEATVLSNKKMRTAIDDPSDLVYERRKKAPRNCLESWRVERFVSVDELFTEPLIPCKFSKVHSGASVYPLHKPIDHNKTVEKPLNLPCESFTDDRNVGALKFEQSRTPYMESEVQESETIEKSVNIRGKAIRSEKIRRRLFEPETPESEPHRISTDLSDWVHDSEVPSMFGSLRDGPTPRILTQTLSDTTLSFLDGELGSHDGDDDADQTKEGSVWSARTRYVAHHLHQKASVLKTLNHGSLLSLAQMLEGKKRKACARFFYETLMLKGHGMIDVKQDSPYGDIQISVTPRLDEELRNI